MKIIEYIKLFLKNKLSIKGKMNKIFLKEVKVRKNKIFIEGKRNYLEINNKAKIKNSSIYIKGNDIKLIFDENVEISNSFFEIYGDKNEVYIGKRTSFSGVRLTSAEERNKIYIGDDCLFSYNIDLRNTDSHKIYRNNILINEGKEVVIKDRVWVGEGVNILKGVFINSDNVIGAGALVNKNIFEKNVVIGGNPAKIIKRDIKWKK